MSHNFQHTSVSSRSPQMDHQADSTNRRSRGSPASSTMNAHTALYGRLLLEPTATTKEIKSAYRNGIRLLTHVKGRTREQKKRIFESIHEAYLILSNERTRQTYDIHGYAAVKAPAPTSRQMRPPLPRFWEPLEDGSGWVWSRQNPAGASEQTASVDVAMEDAGAAGSSDTTMADLDAADSSKAMELGRIGRLSETQERDLPNDKAYYNWLAGVCPTIRHPVYKHQQKPYNKAVLKRPARQSTLDDLEDLLCVKPYTRALSILPTARTARKQVVRATLEELATESTHTIRFTRVARDATGTYTENIALRVQVPEGYMTGSEITLSKCGDTVKDKRQDVICSIFEIPHPIFARGGNNLYTRIELDAAEARLGWRREIVGVDGEPIVITQEDISDITGTGMLVGHGMPDADQDVRGNLYVSVTVIDEDE